MQAAFEATRNSLVGRPWAVDDLDRILQQWQHKHYRKAVLFVDNAGSDVILGGPHPHSRGLRVHLPGMRLPWTQPWQSWCTPLLSMQHGSIP